MKYLYIDIYIYTHTLIQGAQKIKLEDKFLTLIKGDQKLTKQNLIFEYLMRSCGNPLLNKIEKIP